MRCVKLTFCWFLSETNILAVTNVKSTFKPFLTVFELIVRGIDILLVSKRNQPPCRHALT